VRTSVLVFIAAIVLSIPTTAFSGDVVEVARGAASQQPQVAIDADGVIHIAFGAKSGKAQGDILYARSDDGGKSFSPPINLGTVSGLALGMRRGPRIAVCGNAICISVIGHKDGNILLFRSTDKGKTWDQAATVNDELGSAGEGLHAMAASPNGELTCIWLDHRNKQSEVFASTSTDGGKTWSKNVLAYRSPDGDVCPCCHPSVTYSPSGEIHVLWRNALGGSRDMYHAVSSDGGKTFAKALKLGAGTWPLDRCPMDGGSIAVLANGKSATVWRRDKTVYFFGAGSSQETILGPGEQPWVTASSKGPIAVWLRKRGESLLLRLPGADLPVELSRAASDPIVASGGPKNEVVVAAWEDSSNGVKKIVCQRIDLTK
jgi:hypothetical protein